MSTADTNALDAGPASPATYEFGDPVEELVEGLVFRGGRRLGCARVSARPAPLEEYRRARK